jgi:hypothetical protein
VHVGLHAEHEDPGPDQDQTHVDDVDVLLDLGRHPDREREDAADRHQHDAGSDGSAHKRES